MVKQLALDCADLRLCISCLVEISFVVEFGPMDSVQHPLLSLKKDARSECIKRRMKWINITLPSQIMIPFGSHGNQSLTACSISLWVSNEWTADLFVGGGFRRRLSQRVDYSVQFTFWWRTCVGILTLDHGVHECSVSWPFAFIYRHYLQLISVKKTDSISSTLPSSLRFKDMHVWWHNLIFLPCWLSKICMCDDIISSSCHAGFLRRSLQFSEDHCNCTCQQVYLFRKR